MKHIGIVDITTVGACICANAIVAKAAERMGNAHPEFTMHAFPFERYWQAIHKKDWSKVAELVLASIEKLKQVGADFIIMPSNTPHYAFEQITKYSPLPILNLIEIVVNECHSLGYRRVLILGTKQTMQGDLYSKPLAAQGIFPMIPSKEDQEFIHQLIFDEIISSKINPFSVEKAIKKMQQYACDAVILGCTELPEVFNQNNLDMPILDTTRLLAYKALEYSIKTNESSS